MNKFLLTLCAALLAGAAAAKPVFHLKYAEPRAFDGKKPGIILKDPPLHNPEKGITVMAVLRQKKLAANDKINQTHDMIVQRNKQFLLGYDHNRIYINFHDGKDWNIYAMVNAPHNDQEFHAVALTVLRINDITQGDNYLQVKLYFDGELLWNKNFTKGSVPDSKSPVTIACSEQFGDPWRFAGDLADVCAYNRVLTVPEIQKYTAQFKQIRNRPGIAAEIAAKDLALLKKLSGSDADPAIRAAGSALRNLAEKDAPYNWRNAANQILKAAKNKPFKLPASTMLKQYKIQNAILTVVTKKDLATAVSLYDTLAGRELLCRDNPWFRIKYKGQTVSSLDSRFKCNFKALGSKKFQLSWQSPALTVKSVFDCKDMLAYDLEVRQTEKNSSLQKVEFPALELRPLSGDGTLCSAILSGVAQPDAIKNGYKFECIYPRAFGAMQYGAFYDKKSGVYWSSADPLARVKMLHHTPAADRVKVRYEWTPSRHTPFTPKCSARVAVFGGNWYDAAMLYRKQIWEIKARWLPDSPVLPRTDTASWFRENPYWGGLTISNRAQFDALKAMRDYIGLPMTVSLYRWNSLVWDRDYPHHKSQPEYLEHLDECHRLGIKAVPYINGRLWEHKDRREHDYLYTKLGKANCVRNADGTIAGSKFNDRQFSIICPYTKIYEKMMQTACKDALLPGADGVYVDQIGAAAHILCYDPKHGHPVPDDTSWFIKGHDKVFSKIRAEHKAKNPDVVFSTEDNAENCVRNFDGMEVWRWTYDHQVPAFSAVYSGYVQFYGIGCNRKYPEAHPAILAWQFVTSTQIGWIYPDHFITPEFHNVRVWSKQLMRLRIAMLDFFNAGIMARPAEFVSPVPAKRIRWGYHGTGWVTTPDIYSTSWQWDGILAVPMLNISQKSPHNNTVRFTLPGKGKYTLYSFSSCGKAEEKTTVSGKVEQSITIAPQSFQLLIAVPEGKNADRLLTGIRGQFREIVKIPGEKDPFVPDKTQPVAKRDKDSGFLRINAGHYRCMFMAGSMFPIRFTSNNYRDFGKLLWDDSITINKKTYRLYVDRYAQQEILENTPKRLVIRCTGTMCARGREEEPPLPVKAVYTYTFVPHRPWVDVQAQVSVGDGKEPFSDPELLSIRVCSHESMLKVEKDKTVVNGKTFTRNGKIIVKSL